MATPKFSPFVTFGVTAGTGVTKTSVNADITAILALIPNSNGNSLGTPGTPGSGVMPDADAVRPEWETQVRAELVALQAAITAA